MARENGLFFTLKISIGPVLDEIAVSKIISVSKGVCFGFSP